jgi:hypothetical protein
MRVPLHLSVLLLAGACGSTPIRETPAAPPPLNPGDVAPDNSPQDDAPVAYIDDQPVPRRAVVDYAMTSRGKELIEKYILWKLRKDRLDELKVKNTPDDLRTRARLWIELLEKQVGEAGIKKKLDEMKMTKENWVERFVASGEFDEHVRNEKAVVYSMLTDASIEIDTVAFTDPQEAASFAAQVGKSSFGQACERLQVATNVQGRIAYWPRYRFPRGLAPDVIAATPELEKKLFGMKKGETTGVESTSKNILVVVHVFDTHAAAPGTYAAIADKVMAEILRQPPSEEQIRLWMDRLFKSKRIRYEDRYSPGNQGR